MAKSRNAAPSRRSAAAGRRSSRASPWQALKLDFLRRRHIIDILLPTTTTTKDLDHIPTDLGYEPWFSLEPRVCECPHITHTRAASSRVRSLHGTYPRENDPACIVVFLTVSHAFHPSYTQSPQGLGTVAQSGAQLRDWDCSPSLEGGTARDCGLSANRFERTVRDEGRRTLPFRSTGTAHLGRAADCSAPVRVPGRDAGRRGHTMASAVVS